MNKEKMTVHKALAELKVIDDRIVTAIQNNVYCSAKKHSSEQVSGIPVADFEKNARAALDKATSLINRRNAIKRAVVLSNATTKIKIGDIEYTVAEAIEMKNHGMEYQDTLVQVMRKQYSAALATVKRENSKDLEERADQYVTAIYGQKEGKTNDANVVKLHEDFIKMNQFELVDPINILEQIENREQMIGDFMSEIDAALSVSNALTEIEIEY